MSDEEKNSLTDHLDLDLLEILADSLSLRGPKNHPHMTHESDMLMQKLSSYIVRRDHQVFNHAMNLGKKQSYDRFKVLVADMAKYNFKNRENKKIKVTIGKEGYLKMARVAAGLPEEK